MDYTEQQKKKFSQISVNYDKIHSSVHLTHSILQKTFYYERLIGKSVLDVGNGGRHPRLFLGDDIARSLRNFVGYDTNKDMMARSPNNYNKVIGSGFNLPFSDKSFDYVTINGVLHHLGYKKDETFHLRLFQFLKELQRVSKNSIIVSEAVVPKYLETMEKIAANVLGYMPTFAPSEETINDCCKQLKIYRREVRTYTLSELTNPMYWYLVIMDYPWLKIPAFLNPIQHSFFVLSWKD